MASKESTAQYFTVIDAATVTARLAEMKISEKARSQMQAFLTRFAAQGFLARNAPSTDYYETYNNFTMQFESVATPSCATWLKFGAVEGKEALGGWFYANGSRGLLPMADAPFDRLKVIGMGVPIIFAWENSDNDKLLNLPMSEKVDEYPYFRIKPSDRLLIFDMGRANILEASPVYTCTLRQVKVMPAGSKKEGMMKIQQLQQVFSSVAEMYAALEKIQYSPMQYNGVDDWKLSVAEQQTLKAEGVTGVKSFVELG
jgi:hypothetical protein